MLRLKNLRLKNLVIVWIISLSVLYSSLSILRHNHFQSGGFDLGLYDQAVWQYSRLTWPYNTIKERFILGDHLTLTLPLLAPLFWLWNNVRILLIFQAFWLALSAWPIFRLAQARKFTPLTALSVSFVYSLFYGLQFAVFSDFHPVIIGVGLISWLVYFLETNQQKPFAVTLVLLLLTQENMGLALACLGMIYFFQKKFRQLAIYFLVFGLLYSLIAAKVIAIFSPVGFQYWPEVQRHPLKIITEFFNAPEKRQVWLYSLSWFSFLPLLSPGAILAVFLDLTQYFVTGQGFARMWSPFMHHRAILAPLLTLGTMDGLQRLKQKKINPQVLSVFLVAVAAGLQYFFHFPLNKLSKPIYWKNEPWMEDNQSLFKIIPPDVSLAAQQSLVSHLSHRREIYLAWPQKRDFENKLCGEKSCWWLNFGGHPEYLVVDLHPNQWLTQLLESNENFADAVRNMEKAEVITLEKEVHFAKLYKINRMISPEPNRPQ